MDALRSQPQIQEEVDEPKSFGDVWNFWTRYDDLANTFDNDMIKRLNENLDVLLIFAGLFSAVDTAFIVVALTALSVGPADQTNHLLRLLLTNGTNSALTPGELGLPSFAPSRGAVRQNCLFFASLCFSLLAAAGAVVAKQWLQYYQGSGQTGTVRKQGMRRTKKFEGAEAWGLAHTVEALPALILISLAFFSAALVDYLWAVNRDVAIVVSTLTAFGFLAYGVTLIAGIMSGACPFQTSFAKSVRKLYRRRRKRLNIPGAGGTLVSCGGKAFDSLLQTAKNSLHLTWDDGMERGLKSALKVIPATARFAYKTARAVASVILDPFQLDSNVQNDQWIYVRSVIWMAETAPERDNIIIIAHNIPLISDLRSIQLLAPSDAFAPLLLEFRSSILALRRDHAHDCVANAVTMAKAVAHIALADPGGSAEAISEVFLGLGNLGWLADLCRSRLDEPEELMILLISISNVFELVEPSKKAILLRAIKATLHTGLRNTTRKGAAAATHLHHCILTAPTDAASWEEVHRHIDDISKTLLVASVKSGIAMASCAAHALSLTLRASPAVREQLPITLKQRVEMAWKSRTKNTLAVNLLSVMDALAIYYTYARTSSPPHPVYEPLLQCQARLLIHGKEAYSSSNLEIQQTPKPHASLFQSMHSTLNINVQEVIALGVAASHPSRNLPTLRHCRNELVGFLRNWLLTPGPQWHEVLGNDLEATAHLAIRVEGAEGDKLSEAILYRYFVHVQRDLYPTHTEDQRHLRLSQDARIGPVLVSALRLYLWLYPTADPRERWMRYEKYLRSLATGQVEPDDTHFIGWMPVIITRAQTQASGISEGHRLRNALDPWRSRKQIRFLTYDDHLASQVDDTVVRICDRWDLDQYETTGSCMLWLAESFRVGEKWVQEVDRTRVIELFIGIMRKHGSVEVKSQGDMDVWSRVDIQAAGALFLRAWEAPPAEVPDTASESKLLGWMDTDTISAIGIWLRSLDDHQRVAIKETDNVIFIQAPVDLALVRRFLRKAREANPAAVEKYKLDFALDEFVQGHVTTPAEITLRGATPSPMPTGGQELILSTQHQTQSPDYIDGVFDSERMAEHSNPPIDGRRSTMP
ncbi:hypothetical protein FRB95_008869 [Tulasnella sp. JGI-2019a]|nr:hypothetical protein FRB95_008869 [Tulasnella sp. JGI-2019a]